MKKNESKEIGLFMDKKNTIELLGIIAAIITLVGSIIALVSNIIEFKNSREEPAGPDTVIISYQNFIENNCSVDLGNGDVNINSSTDYINSGDIETLLNRVGNALMQEKDDVAIEILANEKLSGNKAALLDKGYIYMNGNSIEGKQLDRAESCFIDADCLEADRALLALYLKGGFPEEKVTGILGKLLWLWDDNQTWDYIADILYNQTWDEYAVDEQISKEEFSFYLSVLYEWEGNGNYYRGYNPPEDTDDSKWIMQDYKDTDIKVYFIYEEYRRKFERNLDEFQGIYVEKDGEIIKLN